MLVILICSLCLWLSIRQTVNCASQVSVLRAPKLSTLNSASSHNCTSYMYITFIAHSTHTHNKSLICQAIHFPSLNECSSIYYVPFGEGCGLVFVNFACFCYENRFKNTKTMVKNYRNFFFYKLSHSEVSPLPSLFFNSASITLFISPNFDHQSWK